jgi:hypothetical protein
LIDPEFSFSLRWKRLEKLKEIENFNNKKVVFTKKRKKQSEFTANETKWIATEENNQKIKNV